MEAAPSTEQDAAMAQIQITPTGRALRDPAAVAREARRLVGLERHYSCTSCGAEHHSWSRMSGCPECGTAFASAVIRRAAIAAA
jgi:predicted RNA-binding Zn-ribbon protein involved in translation (DUF1610 family)